MKRPAARSRRLLLAELLGAMGLLMALAVGWRLLAERDGARPPEPRAARFTAPALKPVVMPEAPVRQPETPPPPPPVIASSTLDRNLILAASSGDAELVARLLAAGASVHGVDERGRSALLVAVYEGRMDAALRLLQAGADVNGKDIDVNSPFLVAAATGQTELVRVALQHGADPRSTDRYHGTALVVACQQGNTEVVRVLLQAGVPVDQVNDLGWSPLLEAVVLGDGSPRYEEIVQLLLDAGADANLADRDGMTPTRHARERGYKSIVRMLMRVRGH